MEVDEVYDEMQHNVRELEELGVEVNDRISRIAKRMSFGIEEMKAKKAYLESDIKRLEARVAELKRGESTLKTKKRQRVPSGSPSPKRQKVSRDSHDLAASQPEPPSSLRTQNLASESSEATKAPLLSPSPPKPTSDLHTIPRPQPFPNERKSTGNSHDLTIVLESPKPRNPSGSSPEATVDHQIHAGI